MDKHIMTYSGELVSLTEGVPTIEDIAISSARTPMFAGQSNQFHSVAHHCLVATSLAEQDKYPLAIFVLLHRAEVSVFGSVPDQVKCPQQRIHERELRNRIFTQHGLGIPDQVWDRIESYDRAAQEGMAGTIGPSGVSRVPEGGSKQKRALIHSMLAAVLQGYLPAKNLAASSELVTVFLKKFGQLRKGWLNGLSDRGRQALLQGTPDLKQLNRHGRNE